MLEHAQSILLDSKAMEPGPELIKLFLMLNSTEHEISPAKYRQIKKFLALSLLDVVFIMLINVKMPTIIGILTFMSAINFIKFYNSGPDFFTLNY